MTRETKFQTVGEAFEFMRMDGSQSLALIDCMNAYELGKDQLEKHFDDHLWLDAGSGEDQYSKCKFDSDAAQQYYIELGRIEEFLVHQELIYQD